MRAQILRNTVSNYAAKLIALGAGLFLTPFILGHIGATMYGLWVLMSAVVGYGSLLDLAISAAIIKYIAQHREVGEHVEAREILATSFAVHVAIAAVASALVLVLAPFVARLVQVPASQQDTATLLIRLMGVGVALSIPCSTPAAVLRGLHRFDLSALLFVVSTTVTVGATVAVLLLGGGVIGLVLVNISILVLMQVPSVWVIGRIAPELHFGPHDIKPSRIRTVLAFSWSLFVLNAAGHLQTKTDEVVIGTILPVSAVTPYALAHRLSDLPQMLTDQFLRVLPPLASALDAGDERVRLRGLYTASTRLTLVAFLPIGLAVSVLAGALLTLWVGAEYAGFGYLVVLLTFASLIDTTQWPGQAIVQGMARHRPIALMAVASGIANLALSIVLCRRYGLAGVAVGTLVPTAFVCLAGIQPYVMRTIGATVSDLLREVYLPALLPAVPAAIVLLGLRGLFQPSSFAGVLGAASAGAAVYLGVYLAWTAPASDREMTSDAMAAAIRVLRGSEPPDLAVDGRLGGAAPPPEGKGERGSL